MFWLFATGCIRCDKSVWSYVCSCVTFASMHLLGMTFKLSRLVRKSIILIININNKKQVTFLIFVGHNNDKFIIFILIEWLGKDCYDILMINNNIVAFYNFIL